jgi:hypothetical protein
LRFVLRAERSELKRRTIGDGVEESAPQSRNHPVDEQALA